MESLIYPIVVILLIAYGFINKRAKAIRSDNKVANAPIYRYSVYKIDTQVTPRLKSLILEGNEIDKIGYEIYKAYANSLDLVTIIIKDNQDDKVMQIVKESDSESIIGVTHPINGHIGYLQFIEVDN